MRTLPIPLLIETDMSSARQQTASECGIKMVLSCIAYISPRLAPYEAIFFSFGFKTLLQSFELENYDKRMEISCGLLS